MSAECCDVMMAHSPPLFTSRNAAEPANTAAAGLVMYQNFRLVLSQQNMSPMSVRRLSARSSNSPTREDASRQGSPTAATAAVAAAAETTRPMMPTRPCLIIRTDSDASIGSSSSSSSSSSDENEPTSPTRSKKKVVFADDRGLSLTHVRLMSEPSNQPPKLLTVSPYLNQQLQSAGMAVGGGASNTAAMDLQQWQLMFPQPASNYMDFRRRLAENNVSLENVIIKSLEKRIVGTVKVRNLSYDKEVFVRSTRDRWATHQDTLCTYVQNNAMVNGGGPSSADQHQQLNPVTAIYDTFVFRLPLPADAASMEFAVCYKSVRFEYWDSNGGNNYRLSVGGGGPLTQKQQQQHVCAVAAGSPMTSGLSTVDLDHVHPQPAVHYFGSQSRHNSWNVQSRDLLKDNGTTAYW